MDKRKKTRGTVNVSWRGTNGVGDFMMALNCCHRHAFDKNVHVNLEMHWDHAEDYYHHFEEEETIIERMAYIHNFYQHQDQVTVTHVFKSRGKYYYDPKIVKRIKNKNRFTFSDNHWSDKKGHKIPRNGWLFREEITNREIDKKKIVIWRATFNAEIPSPWKRSLTNRDWDGIIAKLRRAGLHVVELTYRTPVSEAMYHISTCRMVMCYDGMWHYIAKNCARPMLVVSKEGITKYHTPHAIRSAGDPKEERSVHWWMRRLPRLLGHTKKKALDYHKGQKRIYSSEHGYVSGDPKPKKKK